MDVNYFHNKVGNNMLFKIIFLLKKPIQTQLCWINGFILYDFFSKVSLVNIKT
jgi:hypothetical protein